MSDGLAAAGGTDMGGMAYSWKRMVALGVLGLISVGVTGVGGALMTAPGHSWVQDQLASGDTVTVEEWLATPILGAPNFHVIDPSMIAPSLEPWARPDLRREFDFNGKTYLFLLVDSDSAAPPGAAMNLTGFTHELGRLTPRSLNHADASPGMPPRRMTSEGNMGRAVSLSFAE